MDAHGIDQQFNQTVAAACLKYAIFQSRTNLSILADFDDFACALLIGLLRRSLSEDCRSAIGYRIRDLNFLPDLLRDRGHDRLNVIYGNSHNNSLIELKSLVVKGKE